MSKDHFYFNRTDRIVALILLTVIVAVNIVRIVGIRKIQDYEVAADSTAYSSYHRQTRDSIRIYYKRDTVHIKTYVRDTVIRKSIVVRDSATTVRFTAKSAPAAPVDLNASDSAALVTLPGIGPVSASRIIRYRDQLGGFTHTTQLAEIDGLPDSLMKWFILTDTVPVRKIMVNSASVAELRRHPYINFYQARAIVEYRRERGIIKGPHQLSFMQEFTDGDLERLLPYLDFR
jgi:DNA uptake protein ComE-like DNA-binding protein